MTAQLIDALQRCAAEPGTGRALPAGCYTDPAFFELERERVLRPGWHAVARWDELPNPGDYRAIDVAGEGVLLVRGEDRELRAMSSICLHRAFPIAQDHGNTKRFTCPYHRWAYDLEGRLKAAPFMEDVAGFDRDACRLPQLPLELWQGFVFVSADPNAAALGAQLKELAELLAPMNLESARHVGTTEWDSPWNWKVMIENFMESYHHIGPHVDSLAKTYPAKGTHDLPIEGPCAVLENPAVEGADPFWVMQIFPTTMLAQFRGDLPVTTWYEMQIDRHDHFTLRVHNMLPEPHSENEALVEMISAVSRDVHLEDIPACEGIQRGLQSRAWQPGALSQQEATLRHFHRYLAERVGATASG
jgi:phenylpropionate dioxygenase-like ring-hydroxylating dioxygenase large terminal subunit